MTTARRWSDVPHTAARDLAQVVPTLVASSLPGSFQRLVVVIQHQATSQYLQFACFISYSFFYHR